MTLLIIYLIVIFNLISIWNGYGVLDITTNNEKTKMYSHRWHIAGLAIRIMLWGLIPLLYLQRADITYHLIRFDWLLVSKWTGLFVVFGGFYYDVFINTIRYIHEGSPKLTYVDYKNWNKFFVDALRPLISKIIHEDNLEKTKNAYFWSRIILSIIFIILVIF
jgi:hypothetical protein